VPYFNVSTFGQLFFVARHLDLSLLSLRLTDLWKKPILLRVFPTPGPILFDHTKGHLTKILLWLAPPSLHIRFSAWHCQRGPPLPKRSENVFFHPSEDKGPSIRSPPCAVTFVLDPPPLWLDYILHSSCCFLFFACSVLGLLLSHLPAVPFGRTFRTNTHIYLPSWCLSSSYSQTCGAERLPFLSSSL